MVKVNMSKEELLLEYWRELPSETQDQVLETIRSLQPHHDDLDLIGPEHLIIRSKEHLNELITEGLNSGEPIEVTDEWWAEKRRRLLEQIHN
jgi:hypothetical protein